MFRAVGGIKSRYTYGRVIFGPATIIKFNQTVMLSEYMVSLFDSTLAHRLMRFQAVDLHNDYRGRFELRRGLVAIISGPRATIWAKYEVEDGEQD